MTGTQDIGRQTQIIKRHTRVHLIRRLRRFLKLLEAPPLFFFFENEYVGRGYWRRPAPNTETERKCECLKTTAPTILNCIHNFAHSPNMMYTESKVLNISISNHHSAWPATRGTQQRSEHVAFQAAAQSKSKVARFSSGICTREYPVRKRF